MKKLILSIAAVAMIFATSCKKESVNEPEMVREPETNEFCAEIDANAVPQNMPAVKDGMTTKTYFADNSVKWETGDKIYVNADANSFSCTVTTEGTTRAYFENDEKEGGKAKSYTAKAYYAFYGPVSNIDTTTKTAIASLSGTQTYLRSALNGQVLSNLPMYAYSKNHWLTFKNLCGVLKITVPQTVTSADKIVVTADKDINGSFSLKDTSYTNQSNTVYCTKAVINNASSSDANKSISVSGTFAKDDVVYIAIPDGKYKFNIQFKNGDAVVKETGMSTNEYPVVVNKIHEVKLPSSLTSDMFCFTARAANTQISISGGPAKHLDYKKVTVSGGETTGTFNSAVTLSNVGDRLYIYATNGHTNIFATSTGSFSSFKINSGQADVSGDILYLINSTDRTAALNAYQTNEYQFCGLFETSRLINAKDLIIPSVTPAKYGISYLFFTCYDLETGPTLPAEILSESCYENMFHYDTKLKSMTILATDNMEATKCLHNFMTDAGSSVSAGPDKVVYVNNAMTTAHSTWTTLSNAIPSGYRIETENGTVLRQQ